MTAEGNLSAACEAFEASLAIAEQLVRADPSNAEWQRELGVSHFKLGEALTAEGNLPAARGAFEASLTIDKRLVAADPSNPNWQRDLAVSHVQLGDVLSLQRQKGEAIYSYREGVRIARRLCRADPTNATWRSDLRHVRFRLAASWGRLWSVRLATLGGIIAWISTSHFAALPVVILINLLLGLFLAVVLIGCLWRMLLRSKTRFSPSR